jgi:predicted phosphodiesterase
MARILLVSDDHCYTRCFGRQAPDGTVIFATRTEKLSEFVKIEAKCDFVIHAGDFENDIN